MNGNGPNIQPAAVPPQPSQLNASYSSSLPGGSSPSRQYNGGYGNSGNQFRENWWNNGYSNARQSNNYNKVIGNATSGFFTRRKNYM